MEDVDEIVSEHLLKGRMVQRLVYDDHGAHEQNVIKSPATRSTSTSKQKRVALRNCGVINPENIDEYIAFDGYKALGKVLTEMTPRAGHRRDHQDSGLRGRGGGGFPTGLKWKLCATAARRIRSTSCCNADEGDPGAFMDRSRAGGRPALRASKPWPLPAMPSAPPRAIFMCVRSTPSRSSACRSPSTRRSEYGLLGKNIFGTGFNFDIDIRLGAGAFVCGEETALMTSIEGKRGEPRPRPPFPAVKGLFGKPTVLNNVETYANVPQIILKGADWFASMGTEKSKGTKVFALGGKINNTGLVEVPMGTTLRTIIDDIGGGIPNGKKFKAAQTGGPSGGCIPAELSGYPDRL